MGPEPSRAECSGLHERRRIRNDETVRRNHLETAREHRSADTVKDVVVGTVRVGDVANHVVTCGGRARVRLRIADQPRHRHLRAARQLHREVADAAASQRALTDRLKESRERELEALVSAEVRAALSEAGVELVDYRMLRE